MAKEDLFPATRSTWIGDQLRRDDCGRAEVNRHVMTVYALPLRAYFLGTSERWLGDADDIVQGFFADRLARDDFFASWQQSGMPLRRWLMNAFCFFLKEQRRRHRRDSRGSALGDDPITFSGDPDAAIDRAFVVSLVQRALDLTREGCENDSMGDHWRVFEEHHCRGRPYADIAADLGTDAARAAVMARTATRRFRMTLRELLARDSAGDRSDIDEQIRALVENLA